MDNGTLIGIVLTIVFGVIGIFLGLRAVKKKSQNQTVRNGSTAIQSGRNTNIKN